MTRAAALIAVAAWLVAHPSPPHARQDQQSDFAAIARARKRRRKRKLRK